MIELEESINSAQVQQITAERMRKSSRLLRDSKSQQRIEPRHVETGKLSKIGHRGPKKWNWQHQKYSELLKLMRLSTQIEKEPEVARSLDHNDNSPEYFSQHFKGSWKPSLESEILISHCKQHKTISKYPVQSSNGQYRHKSKHEGIYFRKEKCSELILFKSQLRNSDNRHLSKRSRPSFIKHLLKIEDQPARVQQHTPKFTENIKESITLQPLRKVHERLKSITPQKSRQGLHDKKSLPLKLSEKRNHMKQQSESLNLKKSDVSAWTFHNIEQSI